jgi:hypothetical protein
MGIKNMSRFKDYLQQYEIDAVRLSIAARVRYSAAWNAQQGNAIPAEDAHRIKAAVLALTGVPYLGSFNITQHKQQNLMNRSLCPRMLTKEKKKGTYRDGRIIKSIRGGSYSSSR